MPAPDCPSEDDLKAFLLGDLPETLCQPLADHLEVCPRCEAVAERLDRLEDPIIRAVRASDSLTIDAEVPATENGRPGEGKRPAGPAVLPDRIGDYLILGELGRGGMGVVYKARQARLNRPVALKMILHGDYAGATELSRFRTEAETIARLQHPNIVAIHEVNEHEGKPFLSLEFCPGGSLDRKLGGTPLPAREAARLVETLARAMQAAHDKNVIHRDLKPANVLLAEDGTPKISDFGLARKLGEAGQTQTGAVVGTPSYMAPEQAGGRSSQTEFGNEELGPLVDVYALGAILYVCLRGGPPFTAPTAVDTLFQVVHDEPVPPRQLQARVPRDLETICLKCLEKSPPRRYASAAALADDLQRFQAGEPITGRPAGRLERALKWARRRPTAAALVAVSLVALACAALLSAAFYRIQTDTGELVITAESDDVEVLVKQGGKVVRIIDTKTGRQVKLVLPSGTYELELPGAPKGLKLSIDKATLTRGETVLAKVERKGWPLKGHAYQIVTVAFSPDGRLVLTGAGIPVEGTFDCYLQLWDAETGQELRRFKGHRSSIYSAAFSPDGKRIVSNSATPDNSVRIWDVESGKQLKRILPLSRIATLGVVFGLDGKHVFSCDEAMVRMWEVETGREVRRFVGHRTVVRCLAISRDGRYLVSGGTQKDTSIRVWEVESGKEVQRFEGHPIEGETSIAFLPDGGRVVSGGYDGTLRLWDVSAGKEVRRFEGHQGPVSQVAVSPDGRRVLSAGSDRTVRLWDLETGKELDRFTGHTDVALSVAFSPDGRTALSGSADNTARLWRLPDPPAAKDKP
jgi:WD40 repeat protein/tRNA A-37 threonylcarbamoyl transferase component Bud32